MSKKLIAVASAAAIALSALIAVPAQAADFTVVLDAGASDVATAAMVKSTPATHAAPENNEVEFVAAASGTAVRFTVSGTSSTDVTTSVSAAGGVRLVEDYLDADDENVALSAGVTSLSLKYKTSNNAVFYAYSTSTTAGSVSITAGGNTKVYYVASRVGNVYNVAATFPSFVAAGGSGSVSAVLTDVFGNAINATNASETTVDTNAAFAPGGIADLKLTVVGGTIGDTAAASAVVNTQWKYVATSKAWVPAVTTSGTTEKIWVASGSSGSLAARIDVVKTGSTGVSRDREVGLAAPKSSAFSTLTSGDLAAQVAALTAQIATMRLKADSVTQRKYNTLARKWNAAFPGQKVALKK